MAQVLVPPNTFQVLPQLVMLELLHDQVPRRTYPANLHTSATLRAVPQFPVRGHC